MHIIFSSEIAGAGLAQGPPAFYIPPDDLEEWPEDTVDAVSIPAIDGLLGDEKIDDVSNLEDAPVFVVAGSVDELVPEAISA